jgi:hypothetical protein
VSTKSRITYVTYDSARQETMPVDAVYTWVNPTDTTWQDAYKTHVPARKSAPSKKRFNNNVVTSCDAELQTSVELLLKHCPWVRAVYIATMRPQIPPFLQRTEHGAEWLRTGRVKVVHHDEFFEDPSVLPVFNSHPIEANLHRIPNLSQQWLYLNDDFMTGKPVEKNMLFYRGKPVVRGMWMPVYHAGLKIDEHVSSCANNGKALNHLWYFHNDHTTTGVDSDAVRMAAALVRPMWEHTSRARLRGHDQLVPLGLVENAALDNGLYVCYKNNPLKTYAMLYSLLPYSKARFKSLLPRYHFFCINNIPPAKLMQVLDDVRGAFDLPPLSS